MLLEAKKTKKILDSEPNEILAVITKGIMLLGIKQDRMPSDFEFTYMVHMMRKDYPQLPIGEFQLAFDLTVKDKLDENAETYQNFSVLYLSRMLGSYARWARKHMVELPEDKPKLIEQPKVNDEEVLEMAFDIYKKNRNWEYIFSGLRCFKILYAKGFITDFEGTLKRTEQAIRSKFTYASPKDRKEMNRLLEDDEYMELQCRRMAVAEYFENKLKKD